MLVNGVYGWRLITCLSFPVLPYMAAKSAGRNDCCVSKYTGCDRKNHCIVGNGLNTASFYKCDELVQISYSFGKSAVSD